MNATTHQIFARSPQPLYLQVAAIFRRNIQLELWPRGEQVPALDTLVETLGVSRATVRQAFGLLEREGLIHRSRGSGTYVNQDLPRMLTLTLPKTWAESVAVSRILGDTIMLEGKSDVSMPDSLGMECPYRTDGLYQYLRRVHNTDTGPFCFSEVFLDQDIYREIRRAIEAPPSPPCSIRRTARSFRTPGSCSPSSRRAPIRPKCCTFRCRPRWPKSVVMRASAIGWCISHGSSSRPATCRSSST